MALPNNYSAQEHLQDQIRRIWNREVREWFKDLDPDNLDPDINVPRQSLYISCLHQENDTAIMTSQRMQLFSMIKGVTINSLPIAGIPLGTVHESRKFRPQIFFYFQEDEADIEPGYGAVTGQISIRLMNQENVSPTEARQLALKIKTEFGTGNGYIWKKGKGQATYKDPDNGVDTRLFVRTKQEGIDLINKILDVVDKSPDWTRLFYSETEDTISAYPTIPPTKVIFGESRRLPRKRPIADVRFQYAVLHVWGVQNPIPLYDRSGSWSEAIEAD